MRSFSQAARSLVRRPAFAAAAIITLALGIGATTALFSVVDTVLLEPLPFPDAGQLVMVLETSTATHQNASLAAPARLVDWSRDSRSFDSISGSYAENVTETSGAEPERLAGRRVLPRYFDVFGMRPLAGRTFTPDEERYGGPKAAVISEGLWTRRYQRNANAIGQRLALKGEGYTIVGVMPRQFTTAAIDVWLPAQLSPALMSARDARFVTGIGRIKPGITIAQAQSDLASVQRRLGTEYPGTDDGWSASLTGLKDFEVGAYGRALWLVFGAVLLLLLIAVANVAGLLLVQLHRRAHELAVRSAIGASRGQVVGAVMREVAVLAVAGTMGGVLLAIAATRVLVHTLTTVPRIAELAVDWRALAFTMLVSAAAAVLFGLWPALQATRGTRLPLIAQSARGSSQGPHRLQRLLVGAQIALTVLLVASAGLLLRTYYNLSHVSPGFDPSHTLTFHVGAQWDEDRARIGQMQVALIQRLEQTPGVVAAGLTNFLPATGATLRYQIQIEGLTAAGQPGVNAGERTVSAGYLHALRMPLEAGRWCPDITFDSKAPRTAMVNRRFVDMYGEGQSLVGRSIRFDQDPRPALTIVGIVGNTIEDGQGTQPFPYIYACDSAGTWPDPEYVVRAAGDPGALVPVIRRIVHELAPDRAMFGIQQVDTVLDAALDQPRLDTHLLTLFAAAAMLLASLGLYTLLMLLVAERTREIGVRMALGATPLMVVRLVFATAGRVFIVGMIVGLIATVATARVLGTLVYQVSPFDVPTLAGAVLVLVIVALIAAAIPARRAARVDPITAMRAD